MHGQADAYLAQNEARAHDDAVELATVAEHLRPIDLDRLADDGRSLTPREMAELVVVALDGLLPSP